MISVTVNIGNFEGMRDQLRGKGRIQTTIESLLETYPNIRNLDVRIIDNFSSDGSWEYIQGLDFGFKRRVPRTKAKPRWLATTINNMAILRDTVLYSDRDYIWNIENDSYFFNREDFLEKAIGVLESNPDISVVHLRRFTPFDSRESPGVPRNLSRVSEVRKSGDGFDFYVMEKREEYSLWVPTGFGVEDLIPDIGPGMGKCPTGESAIGSIRLNEEGEYERLLTEHWNSYTSHGWIGRRSDLAFLIKKYSPLGERQMSVAFKKHFKAAKLDRDAFIDFGWKLRIKPTEEEMFHAFSSVEKGEKSSIKDFGSLNPPYVAGKVDIAEHEIDVYKK